VGVGQVLTLTLIARLSSGGGCKTGRTSFQNAESPSGTKKTGREKSGCADSRNLLPVVGRSTLGIETEKKSSCSQVEIFPGEKRRHKSGSKYLQEEHPEGEARYFAKRQESSDDFSMTLCLEKRSRTTVCLNHVRSHKTLFRGEKK